MNRRAGRRQPQERRRTSQTVVRTHMAVVSIESGGSGISVRHLIDLVKASLLYADTVEVLSIANQMVRGLAEFSGNDPSSLLALLGSLDDATLQHLSPGLDPSQLRALLPLLSLDPTLVRSLAGLGPEMGTLDGLADILDQSNEAMASSMAGLRKVAESMRVESGVAELERVLDHKVLRLNERVALGEGTEAMVTAFTSELKRYLQDPTKLLVLDSQAAGMARAMLHEGLVTMPKRATANAEEAVLGTGLIARLPAFTAAPVDEVMDLRSDLEEPLGRYRHKVAQLRGLLLTGPFDSNIGAEVDSLWRLEVDPMIADVREAMAEHGLIREFLRSVGESPADFAKGVLLPTALGVFTADALEVNGVVGIAAGVITPAVAAVRQRSVGRATARRNDLFYLYEVNRRLGG
ncbi:hypothetical protein TLA_TLA_02899 [Tessaracoccus lapidicaptus]|nr:hypothetical protein TLA_TLA_02899 [Tessaracoccus lapidicaptus]